MINIKSERIKQATVYQLPTLPNAAKDSVQERNKATALESVQAFMAAFPAYKGENFLVIGDGNHVAVFADYTGTFKNPLMGMKPKGKTFKVKDVDLFTFNDAGKITEHRSVQSNKTIMDMVKAKMKK